MQQELRKTGIQITGDLPWSSHFCLFYRNRRELLDIIVPYFRAGLENKERCVWITGASLTPVRAAGALRKAVPGFDTYLEKGQIEIFSPGEFDGGAGILETGQRLAGWKRRYEQALADGFDGLRITEDAGGQKKDRDDWPDYEKSIKGLVANNRVLFLSAFPLARGGASAILDAVSNHAFALIRQNAAWMVIESNPDRPTKAAIASGERRYRQLLETTTEGVWIAATDGRTIYVNQRMADMLGCNIEDCLKSRRDDFFDSEYAEFARKIRAERERGVSGQYELKLRRRDGSPLWVFISGSPVYDESGKHIANLGMHKDITDRKTAEETLDRSRQNLQRVTDLLETITRGTNVIIAAIDNDFNYTYFNSAYREEIKKLTGKDIEIGSNMLEAFANLPEQREVVVREWGQALRGENTSKTLDFGDPGTLRKTYDVLHTPIYNAGGAVIGAGEIAYDVTARKRAEDTLVLYRDHLEELVRERSRELTESEEKYRTIVETANEGIWSVTPGGKILMVNAKMAELLGYSREEIMGRNSLDFMTAEQKQRALANREKIKRGEKTQTEFHFQRKDGTLIWTLGSATALFNDKGEHFANIAMHTDITERKRTEVEITGYRDHLEELAKKRTAELVNEINERFKAEEALIASEEKFRRIIETTNEGITTSDREGKITFVNERFADMLGYKPEELAGRPLSDHAAPEFQAVFAEQRRDRDRGISDSWEIKLRRKEGGEFWVIMSGTPLYDREKTHYADLAMMTDITERKVMEESLLRLNTELEGRVKERTAELEKANEDLTREISERKLAEEELKKSEERFRNLVTNAPVGISIITFDGRNVFRNRAIAEMGGYTPEELEQIPLSARYLNVEDRRRFLEMARKGLVRNFEVELKRKNGELYWVAMTAIPQTTDFGEGVITISEDITERKRAEERIRYLATFPEFNPTLILEMTREGKVTYTNPALRSVFPGIEGSGKKHKYLADFASFEETTQRNGEKMFSREVNVADAFYEQVIHYLSETERFRIYGRDITERKKLEQELRSASLYARSLIEASLDPLVTINRDGKITDVNRATEQATGLTRQKLIGNDFSDYFTEPEKAKDGYHEVFARGYVRDYPLTMRNISGKTTSVLYNATVYRDEDGETGGVFAAARDVTELKRLETELRRSNADLQQLAYITSHDLQEPLRMITSYLQLIERRYKGRLDADADEFIGYAVNGAARMRTMINDLLEYSRIGTRVQVLQPASTENAFAAALANLEIAIRENTATVTHDPLPVIKADPTQFTMLFQNLIGNGIKFHGRDAPHVHVSARKEAEEWVFSVRDNGIGIEPQYFRRLFQVFQRLHTRDEYPGTGIGLALCKRIVERHGGRIWVESAAGKGATLYFTVPLEEKEPL